MIAHQARALSLESLKKVSIEPALEHVHNRIKEAAMNGQYEIAHPFYGIKNYPDNHAQAQIWARLEKEGYKVTHHDDPDPGHPCGGAYTTIEW